MTSFYRHQLRLLLKKSRLPYHRFFETTKNGPTFIYWWMHGSDPDEVLFSTFGQTSCEYQSVWLTTKYMVEKKMATPKDIPEIYKYMACESELRVKKTILK